MTPSLKAPLNAEARRSAFEAYSAATAENPLDIFIVGGGINGAGAAFDAATRGLSVGVAEMQDWATGTSSRSSKLMHGGLRYLQMLDFKLVAEALRERDLLLTTTAPHLVQPVSFVFPMKNIAERAFIGSGIALYDAMQTGHRAVPMHRHLFPKKLQKHFSGLDPAKNRGGIEYYDATMDDARVTMMLVRSAVNLGAHATSYTRVTDYLRRGERVIGVELTDLLTGDQYTVHAEHVILAGGVWTGDEQDRVDAGQGLEVLASKGIHITVPRDAIQAEEHTGVITQTEKSVLFIIPWDEYWIIGTTDTPWKQDVAHPSATSADIDYVLEHANAVLKRPLRRDDVLGVFAGLRPLLQPVSTNEESSAKVSREHTVMEVREGMSAIAGGKFTTYRVMAEDVVDFALRGQADAPKTRTKQIPIIGGDGFEEMRLHAERRAREFGFDAIRTERLLTRYGSLLGELFAMMEEDPSLAKPLESAPRYLRAEVAYAARAEGAEHLADVLARRTRLIYEVTDRGVDAADEASRIVAAELDWSEARRVCEVDTYRAYIQAHLDAEDVQTDAEAAALVEPVPEVPALI
ncbi:FAD-dependent oxidoreductase [Helcobacillus massiliensis]|uniref:Glycerol-3-phosphate dehydrogenase n=1 Tax=Helcobacillus massiliensis TaxID=521392 RepID=A0A839QRI5_9MICO|nr:glycerol-3-phosphate dehydrogenase [Helcobacillus massiliensis]